MAKLHILSKEDKYNLLWKEFIKERNRRLEESDWIVIKSYEAGTPVPEEWLRYRQALRDLPSKVTKEQVLNQEIPWPEMPKK